MKRGEANKITDEKKRTMRKTIRDYIRYNIQTGKFKPGERIVETKLAKELNVSQAPVREALLELSILGLVEERPYKGAYVRKLTPEYIEDLYNIRAFVEQKAAEMASLKITEEGAKALLSIINEMEASVEEDGMNELTDLDIKFHSLIMDISGSETLKKMWKICFSDWTYLSSAYKNMTERDLLQKHKEICGYILNHEDKNAGAAVYLHISNFKNGVIEYLKRSE
jgi:DNA-binding GntR family transcriptional regulator